MTVKRSYDQHADDGAGGPEFPAKSNWANLSFAGATALGRFVPAGPVLVHLVRAVPALVHFAPAKPFFVDFAEARSPPAHHGRARPVAVLS